MRHPSACARQAAVGAEARPATAPPAAVEPPSSTWLRAIGRNRYPRERPSRPKPLYPEYPRTFVRGHCGRDFGAGAAAVEAPMAPLVGTEVPPTGESIRSPMPTAPTARASCGRDFSPDCKATDRPVAALVAMKLLPQRAIPCAMPTPTTPAHETSCGRDFSPDCSATDRPTAPLVATTRQRSSRCMYSAISRGRSSARQTCALAAAPGASAVGVSRV